MKSNKYFVLSFCLLGLLLAGGLFWASSNEQLKPFQFSQSPPGVIVPPSRLQTPDSRLFSPDSGLQTQSSPSAAEKVKVTEAYGRVPLHFEANQGQVDQQVKFLSRGPGYSLFLTQEGAVLSLGNPKAVAQPGDKNQPEPGADEVTTSNPAVLKMKLVGSNSQAKVVGLQELTGKANYFIGNDPTQWRTEVSTFSQVKYEEVSPGLDLVFYGNQKRLEYDFVVKPGADPSAMKMKFEGADQVVIDDDGNLVIEVAGGRVIQNKPLVYQKVDGQRLPLEGRYALLEEGLVGFQVAEYNREKDLVIDPVLVFSTYLGGTGADVCYGIAVDGSGNAYVTGQTISVDFPTLNAYQAAKAGGYDAFVTKFNSAGQLVYSTYLGGTGTDLGLGIAVDADGKAYVTGYTSSANFPTLNAYQAAKAGGAYDAFVTKLNSAGGLVYSTYLGGAGSDYGNGISVDSAGNAYVTGYTLSANFPTLNPYQAANAGAQDAFVTKLNSTGNGLVYSTYLGGTGDDSGRGIAVDADGKAYVTGYTLSANFPTLNPYQAANAGAQDVFVTKLNSAGQLVYSTYLGGTDNDQGLGITVDADGKAYVTGYTLSANFPTLNPYQAAKAGGQDAFVTKLNSTGNGLVYSTYLGGTDNNQGSGIAVDADGNVYVTGNTSSLNFPTLYAYQAAKAGGYDAFVTKLNSAGGLVYSTYLGGTDEDAGWSVSADAVGNVYVTGYTLSTNFPTRNPYQAAYAGGSFDAFVTKLDFAAPTITTNSPTNGATNVPVNTPIQATFNEAMDPATINTGTFIVSGVTGTVTYDAGTKTATFTPAANLSSNQTYTVTLTTGVKDLVGNAMAADYVFSFTTGDYSAPSITSTTPTNNATGVALNSVIQAVFNEDMDPTTINTSTFTVSGITGTVTYDAGTKMATFTPTANLSSSQTYTATITAGVTDLAGNAMASDYVFSFTTGTSTAPIVTSTTPTNNATGVLLNSVIQAVFNEDMDPATINTSTFTVSGITGTVTYDAGTKTATFTPAANLSSYQTYTATITTGVTDLAGNAMAADYVFSFTTGAFTAPTVTSTTPATNATDVALNSLITAVFSEDMDPATINTGTFTVSERAATATTVSKSTGTVTYDAGTKTATFTPSADLAYNTIYTATITTGAANLAGNHLAADYLWNFYTGNPSEGGGGRGGWFCFISTIIH